MVLITFDTSFLTEYTLSRGYEGLELPFDAERLAGEFTDPLWFDAIGNRNLRHMKRPLLLS